MKHTHSVVTTLVKIPHSNETTHTIVRKHHIEYVTDINQKPNYKRNSHNWITHCWVFCIVSEGCGVFFVSGKQMESH